MNGNDLATDHSEDGGKKLMPTLSSGLQCSEKQWPRTGRTIEKEGPSGKTRAIIIKNNISYLRVKL